jgi:hypothetical protein
MRSVRQNAGWFLGTLLIGYLLMIAAVGLVAGG